MKNVALDYYFLNFEQSSKGRRNMNEENRTKKKLLRHDFVGVDVFGSFSEDLKKIGTKQTVQKYV